MANIEIILMIAYYILKVLECLSIIYSQIENSCKFCIRGPFHLLSARLTLMLNTPRRVAIIVLVKN